MVYNRNVPCNFIEEVYKKLKDITNIAPPIPLCLTGSNSADKTGVMVNNPKLEAIIAPTKQYRPNNDCFGKKSNDCKYVTKVTANKHTASPKALNRKTVLFLNALRRNTVEIAPTVEIVLIKIIP